LPPLSHPNAGLFGRLLDAGLFGSALMGIAILQVAALLSARSPLAAVRCRRFEQRRKKLAPVAAAQRLHGR
jgi:hypothetical protein